MKNIYNIEAKISFLEKIREEKQFFNINELHFQVMQDIQTTKKIHGILWTLQKRISSQS